MQSGAENSFDDEGVPPFLIPGLWQCPTLPQVLSRIWLLIPCVPGACFLFSCLPLGAVLLDISNLMSSGCHTVSSFHACFEVTVPSIQFCLCAGFCLPFSAIHVGQEQQILPLCTACPTTDPWMLHETNKPINREQDSALHREGFNSCIELEREKLPAGTH